MSLFIQHASGVLILGAEELSKWLIAHINIWGKSYISELYHVFLTDYLTGMHM